jgi:hypothetical protein
MFFPKRSCRKTISMKQRTNGRKVLAGLVVGMLAASIPLASAQRESCGNGKTNGTISHPAGLNGTMEFCLPYASQVPESPAESYRDRESAGRTGGADKRTEAAD